PLMITNILENRVIPIYGEGMQVRHWLHVDDHCSGIDTVLRHGARGETYNVGSDDERTNLAVAHKVLRHLDAPEELIAHVTDRVGHDRRYALSSEKLRSLGWEPAWGFEEGLAATVDWYRTNQEWWRTIRSGDFDAYYRANYADRTEYS
ncbi:MAG: GDP-mannose 4,6-dehydratase, partial [Thermomicrobiaceae bacterium]